MTRFADLLPFETFEAAATHAGSEPDEKALMDAFMRFLCAKQQEGALAPIDLDIDAPFIEDWDALTAGRATDRQIACLREAMQFQVMSQVSICKILAKPDLHAAWENFVTAIEAGNLDRLTDMETCRVSGARVLGKLKDWKVELIEVVAGQGLQPAKPATRPGVLHGTIDFPTGDVLVADWFRFADNEFSEAVKARLPEHLPLGSQYGRIACAKAHMSLGMVHVWTGDVGSHIFRQDDILSFGTRVPDAGPLKEADEFDGTIGDVWWTTVIDVQRMIEILTTPERPQTEATALVDAYLADRPWGVARLSLCPGIYHVYYAADPEAFAANVDHRRLPIQDPDTETRFVLSPRPLGLENNQAEIEVPGMPASGENGSKARPKIR